MRVSAKDFFLHVLSIAALYATAGSFVALVFQYINILLPDPLQIGGYYSLDGAYQTIRWSIAMLIVIFPSYLWLMRYLEKEYVRFPAKRDLGIRKWLVYFTLAVAAVIIAGDIVTLVYNLLGGELTMRFVLKVATVGFVAGSVFGYYFYDIKKHKAE